MAAMRGAICELFAESTADTSSTSLTSSVGASFSRRGLRSSGAQLSGQSCRACSAQDASAFYQAAGNYRDRHVYRANAARQRSLLAAILRAGTRGRQPIPQYGCRGVRHGAAASPATGSRRQEAADIGEAPHSKARIAPSAEGYRLPQRRPSSCLSSGTKAQKRYTRACRQRSAASRYRSHMSASAPRCFCAGLRTAAFPRRICAKGKTAPPSDEAVPHIHVLRSTRFWRELAIISEGRATGSPLQSTVR